MTRCAWLKPCLWAAVVALLVCGLPAWSQGQTPAPSAPAAAAAPPPLAGDAPIPVSGPTADDQAAGDPGGTKTGTMSDVVPADATKGVTLADVVNQAGQNRIAINFVWTLVTGFLVMFMQAGFAIVETGLVPRQERQPHHDDELHGLRLRHVRLLGLRVCLPDGRCRRRQSQPGRHAAPLSNEFADPLVREATGASSARRASSSAVRPMTSASWCCSCSRWSSWTRPRPS